jgi:para-nitrobenzyl esterase
MMVAAIMFSIVAAAQAQVTGDPINVDGGQISAKWRANASVRAYLGIPFAAPPVGNLRWKPPQPVTPWDGVRPARAYAPRCMQFGRPHTSVYFEYFGEQPTSEDCLYLNVWAPADAQGRKLPVMVWIYGGGFQAGSAANPVFDGTELARKGVVLVSMNYRVGVFGFLAHPELSAESPEHASGNYGLLDQIAALQWVRRNVAAFGGDPDNITIFGQSAGANSVIFLLGSPLARGLFQHAIAESSGLDRRVIALADAEKAGSAFAQKLGARGIAELRARPAQELLETRAVMFPTVDGWLLPDSVSTLFRQGREAPVPLLAGWNANEGASLPQATSLAAYQQSVRQGFGANADRVLASYPARDDAEARRVSKTLFGDSFLAWGTWAAARLHARNNFPTYIYYFAHPQPMFPGQTYEEMAPNEALGTFHSSEYPYIFGTLAVLTRAWTSADRNLSEQLRSYWVAYATTGSPNAPSLPNWPRFNEAADTVMQLGDQTGPRSVPGLDKLQFFDELFGTQATR